MAPNMAELPASIAQLCAVCEGPVGKASRYSLVNYMALHCDAGGRLHGGCSRMCEIALDTSTFVLQAEDYSRSHRIACHTCESTGCYAGRWSKGPTCEHHRRSGICECESAFENERIQDCMGCLKKQSAEEVANRGARVCALVGIQMDGAFLEACAELCGDQSVLVASSGHLASRVLQCLLLPLLALPSRSDPDVIMRPGAPRVPRPMHHRRRSTRLSFLGLALRFPHPRGSVARGW